MLLVVMLADGTPAPKLGLSGARKSAMMTWADMLRALRDAGEWAASLRAKRRTRSARAIIRSVALVHHCVTLKCEVAKTIMAQRLPEIADEVEASAAHAKRQAAGYKVPENKFLKPRDPSALITALLKRLFAALTEAEATEEREKIRAIQRDWDVRMAMRPAASAPPVLPGLIAPV
jgi:hypothetical protein